MKGAKKPLFGAAIPMMMGNRAVLGLRRYSATKLHNAPSSIGLKQTVLENNVIVATKGPEKDFVACRVSLACGSRYELPTAPGTAHFLKHALFLVFSFLNTTKSIIVC